ncbi:hypothetical protein LTS18_012612 [Coniosporium uncinatum]|uniref:Uncharacterized protein n=1 Tax=Coniosporium uncinatum TaxID=93489 RepID=A0ACC3DJD8_9PEZI|nr:hypothetical protein LTS18_012612 [Coniosporium uncinatum]
MTLPSPTYYHIALKDGESYSAAAYSDDDSFFADLVEAFRKEILALYDAGLRFLQVDDPNMTFFCDEEWLETSREKRYDLDGLLDRYIDVHNAMLKDLPTDLRMGIHLCRGNMPDSTHISSGAYERIAERMLQRLNYEIYYLEFDSPRAGTFGPLRFLPKEKRVVLGIVTTKFPELEGLEELEQRVYEAAGVIAKGQARDRDDVLMDNLAVSPQCGFSSMALTGGKGFTSDIMWTKLTLLRDLARKIWKDAV